jgi:ATP-dependent exoDNAse (exonuclease V) alpha subunit
MITSARQLPTQHLSIRVPWHDDGWRGSVCRRPGLNTACRALSRIASSKDDLAEQGLAGRSFEDLDPQHLPPCVDERALFMAPFPLTQHKRHPYASRNQDLYGHFRPTAFTTQPYSASCVPFHWMLKEHAPEYAARYQLGYQREQEPELGFDSIWIQERANQLAMLDTFFSAVRPKESLCFLYAKDTPLSSSGRRVIVGVGRALSVGSAVEYQYDRPDHGGLRCVLWERNVAHSIREGFEDGFLFPYAEVLRAALERGLDPEQFVAFAPDEAFHAFSYASEHVSHDHAIASLRSCVVALERIAGLIEGPWREVRAWLDRELNRLWRLRGAFPGFGSALTALLGAGGDIVAYELARAAANGREEEALDPWPELERLMRAPDQAEGVTAALVGEGFARVWQGMAAERKALLKLLSRFSLSGAQAARFFEPSGRPGGVDDAALARNPYLLYELDRGSEEPISIQVVDRGMMPSAAIARAHPLPDRCRLEDAVDPRRVRALVVAALEAESLEGHTLLPRDQLVDAVARVAPEDTPCPVGTDVLNGLREHLAPLVREVPMATGAAYQLDRYQRTGELIRSTVDKRVGSKAKRHALSHDWRARVDAALPPPPSEAEELAVEEAARHEKARALEELACSRFSALIGAAGTGKTTLLRVLCGLPEVKAGGVLLLAPTGKARVQLEKKTGLGGQGRTIAQFLMRLGGRYDGRTGEYRVTGSSERCNEFKTVIIDESSMLTEEQLAAVLDGLTGVHRLVLVGDHRQLPPIGGGRPFVDIIRHLAPADIESQPVRVAPGYAELTIPRRQQGRARADLILAGWFGGSTDPAADEIWDRLHHETMEEIRFVPWKTPEELPELLLGLIVEELELADQGDEPGFTASLGGKPYNGRGYMWRHTTPPEEADRSAEAWQIITPIRAGEPGVSRLNQLIQRTFRRAWLEEASQQVPPWQRRIHPPLGRDGILYGDKVINLQNSGRRKVWPERESYVANGDVGVVVGSIRTQKRKLFRQLEVEFTSQPTYSYTFWLNEFGEEGADPLELAYALTVHKTQGSEFGTTFVVLPDPCWLLSRELLYTALTRQQDRVVVLHQGDIHALRRYAREQWSDIARRMTNLFAPPDPRPFEREGRSMFLEEGLIHRTRRGDLVRSKSEVIIANELEHQGIRYDYERALVLPGGETRYPDFTIEDDDAGVVFYWEHLGLLHNPEYRTRWEKKLEIYRAAGIVPLEEGGGPLGTLIVTRDEPGGGIDAQAIAELVSDYLAV